MPEIEDQEFRKYWAKDRAYIEVDLRFAIRQEDVLLREKAWRRPCLPLPLNQVLFLVILPVSFNPKGNPIGQTR